jgi:hypothetical protein
MSWDVLAGAGWPEIVTLDLAMYYAASKPVGTELYTRAAPDR